jgi:hypothetical protein
VLDDKFREPTCNRSERRCAGERGIPPAVQMLYGRHRTPSQFRWTLLHFLKRSVRRATLTPLPCEALRPCAASGLLGSWQRTAATPVDTSVHRAGAQCLPRGVGTE